MGGQQGDETWDAAVGRAITDRGMKMYAAYAVWRGEKLLCDWRHTPEFCYYRGFDIERTVVCVCDCEFHGVCLDCRVLCTARRGVQSV